MDFRKITLAIIAILACDSAALAGGGREAGVAGANPPGGAKHRLFIIRRPLPIQGPASNGTVGTGPPNASSSMINSRIDSKW